MINKGEQSKNGHTAIMVDTKNLYHIYKSYFIAFMEFF